MRIPSKAEYFRLWEAGVLGNRPFLYREPEAAYASGFPAIGFRQLGKAGGGKWLLVPRDQVFAVAEEWKRLGLSFVMDSAIAPATVEHITLQGEVCRTFRGLEGYLGHTPGFHMRPAMAAGLLKHRSGSEVLTLTGRWMDPSSQDDLRELLDIYPDATVEFTCYSIDVGVIPGRNTFFWECRNY